jgi:hypothetical protein
MRRSVLLLASTALALLLSCEVALAQEAPQGTLDARCQITTDATFDQSYGRKMAETFTAGRSGKLTTIQGPVYVIDGDGLVQITTVDSLTGAPTNNALASTTLPSSFEGGFVNFEPRGAASVVAGRRYALVAQAPPTGWVGWSGRSSGSTCSNTQIWAASEENDWRTDYWGSSSKDLIFATYVSPPDTEMVSGPTGFTNSDYASFSFSSDWTPASGETASFQCSLDGAGFGGCESPRSYFDLSEGSHLLKVRSYASSGNPDPTPAEAEWFVDTVMPTGTVTVNSGRASTTSRAVTLSLNAADPSPSSGVASMRLKNAGGSWTAWQTYAERMDWRLTRGAGKKTVYAQYRDAAGNVSASASDSITYRP